MRRAAKLCFPGEVKRRERVRREPAKTTAESTGYREAEKTAAIARLPTPRASGEDADDEGHEMGCLFGEGSEAVKEGVDEMTSPSGEGEEGLDEQVDDTACLIGEDPDLLDEGVNETASPSQANLEALDEHADGTASPFTSNLDLPTSEADEWAFLYTDSPALLHSQTSEQTLPDSASTTSEETAPSQPSYLTYLSHRSAYLRDRPRCWWLHPSHDWFPNYSTWIAAGQPRWEAPICVLKVGGGRAGVPAYHDGEGYTWYQGELARGEVRFLWGPGRRVL